MIALFATVTVKMSLLLGAALLLCALLRRESAALRHWLVAAALGCAALTPLLQTIVPAWSIGLTPQAAQAEFAATAAATAARPATARPPRARPPAAPAGRAASVSQANGAAWPGWPQVLAAVWLAGVFGCLLTLIAGLLRLSRLPATHAASAPWSAILADLQQRFGIRRDITVLESAHPNLLGTWGWRRPKILVPAAARDWDHDRLRIVFAHELAHVQRGDWAVQVAAELFRAICWFNPLAWLACRRLQQESEQACDDAVLGLGIEPPAYATHLLDLARSFSLHRRTWLPAPAIARPSSLERRVTAMLNSGIKRTPITGPGRITAALALLVLAASIAGMAQGGATVWGTARDQSGGLLPGMVMTLELQDPQRPRFTVSATTDRGGHYEFSSLPNGRYLLQGQLPGFTTYTESFTVAVNANLQKDLTLRVGELQETITVIGGPSRPESEPRKPDPRIEQLRRQRGAAPSTAAAAAAPRDATGIGGNIKAPRKIHDERPVYPAAAQAAGIGGVVKLRAIINGEGFVDDVETIQSPSDDLARAAADAVRGWEFTPTLLNGQPVDVRMNVTVQFDAGR